MYFYTSSSEIDFYRGHLATDHSMGRNMKHSLIRTLAIVLSTFSINACGPVLETVGISSGSDKETAETESELIAIEVSVDEGEDTAFRLAAASKFQIDLEGCASGYTSSMDELSPGLNVYKFDRNCKARLVSLEYSGISYTVGNVPFSTLNVGDEAEFVDASGNNRLRIAVTAQLSNPVAVTDTVAFAFVEVAAGADKVYGKNEVATRKTMSVGGQEAPSFDVKALYFDSITESGAGEFRFDLECLSAMSGSGLSSLCNDLTLSQLKYVLVEDIYDGDIDATEAAALFASAGSSVAVDEVISAGSGGLANGGFATGSLVGPDQMHLNPNMLLVIQGAGTSYLYFNVDVTTISASDSL